jgi:hypothetical protein
MLAQVRVVLDGDDRRAGATGSAGPIVSPFREADGI